MAFIIPSTYTPCNYLTQFVNGFTMSGMMAQRVQIMLSDEMFKEMQRLKKTTGANVSALVRIAVADWLYNEHQIEVNPVLDWGGTRQQKEPAQ